MKTNKILFLIAGILNSIIGGIATLLVLLIFMLSNFIREMFSTSYEIVEKYIEAIVAEDPSQKHLLSLSETEAIDYVLDSVYMLFGVILAIGLIVLVFGIINLLLSRRHNNIIVRKKYLGTVLVVLSWLLMPINIINILTTIAVYLKSKDNNSHLSLYSAKDESMS